MATPEEQARIALDQALSGLISITAESLVRGNELGTALDFRKGIPVFERTLRLFRDLKEANLDNVPINTINQLKQLADSALAAFKQIIEFNPAGQGNPVAMRDSLIQQVESQYETYFNQVSPVISYSVRKGTDFEALEQSARTTLEELQRLRIELEKNGKSIVSEAQTSLDLVRRAAAEVGVAQHAIHFKEEANRHKESSTYWLIATALFALSTVIYGGWNIWYGFYPVSTDG